MMIASGCDVRTGTSYLGHASVSMTLDIYADVDPDAKRAAMDKVADSFDVDLAAFSTSAAHRSAERRRAQLLGGPAQGDARHHR